MRIHSIALTLAMFSLTAANVAAGTITGVAVEPKTVAAGGKVMVTVAGSNPCGAANISYGDGGDAVTYAITGLPYSQEHVYAKPGSFTITAKGMGNCDGEVTTTITVSA